MTIRFGKGKRRVKELRKGDHQMPSRGRGRRPRRSLVGQNSETRVWNLLIEEGGSASLGHLRRRDPVEVEPGPKRAAVSSYIRYIEEHPSRNLSLESGRPRLHAGYPSSRLVKGDPVTE